MSAAKKALFILSTFIMCAGGLGKANSLATNPDEPQPNHNPNVTTTMIIIGGLGALAFSKNKLDIARGENVEPANCADFEEEFPFILGPNPDGSMSLQRTYEITAQNTLRA
jgi:hypothetical protein